MKKEMLKDDYELFTLIVQSSQAKLQKILYKLLKRHYNHIENTKDYIVAKGDIPIALVAHMDTVFKVPPSHIYYDRQEGVMWSPDGLGADDRAGVFLIIKILQTCKPNKKPTIIFTTDEERGCLGACQLVTDMPASPYNLKYIIQLDRRGHNDCVFYDDVNVEFIKYIEHFGFETNWGSFSDISVICPAWEISGVNLSVGYYDEHQEIETLHVSSLYRTFFKVQAMLKDVDNAKYFKYEGDMTPWWSPNDLDYWYNDGDSLIDWQGVYCSGCKKNLSKKVAIKAKDSYGSTRYFCGQCASSLVDWCDTCGEAFIPTSSYNHTCADCIAKAWEKKEISE